MTSTFTFNPSTNLNNTTFTYAVPPLPAGGPVGIVTSPPPPNVVYFPPGNYTIYDEVDQEMSVTTANNLYASTTVSGDIYDRLISPKNYNYPNTMVSEEPAIARNAELIKGIKELQTKIKCMKEGSNEFFGTPQAVIIYFEMMMESLFKGKV